MTTKCAVLSCREAYRGGHSATRAGSFALCDTHWREWRRRMDQQPAPWPPCGIERVMADWLRTADAELRNGTTIKEATR